MDKIMSWCVKNKLVLLLAAGVVFLLYPLLFTNRYMIRIGTIALMYVMLTLSLNLMAGIVGQMSFGHAAFWGIGAYTAAILSTKFGCDSTITFLAAAFVSGCFGLLLGASVMKLKRYYFIIVTMAFCEIIRVVELNWMELTNGPLGIMNIPKPAFFGIKLSSSIQVYYLILVLVVLTTMLIQIIVNSHMGYALLALRDDEIAASSMGINVYKYKVITIGISAAIAGIAGAFYAQYTTYIDPSLFSNLQSNNIVVMVIFGGLGNVVGSYIGAIVLSVLPELLRGMAEYRQIIYGLLLVVLMLVRPDGLLGSVNFKYISQKMTLNKTTTGGK